MFSVSNVSQGHTCLAASYRPRFSIGETDGSQPNTMKKPTQIPARYLACSRPCQLRLKLRPTHMAARTTKLPTRHIWEVCFAPMERAQVGSGSARVIWLGLALAGWPILEEKAAQASRVDMA